MSAEPSQRRRNTLRICSYDYSQPGVYFLTICTARRAFLFGGVAASQMDLNEAGRIVQCVWTELPAIHPSLQTDAFVVMPNHIHGIIVILAATANGQPPVGAGSPRPVSGAGTCLRRQAAPLRSLRPTLGQIVARFKYESTRRISTLRGARRTCVWQRGYYDHIVRRGESLDCIRRYIIENPERWAYDPENPQADRPVFEDPWADL